MVPITRRRFVGAAALSVGAFSPWREGVRKHYAGTVVVGRDLMEV